MPVYLLQLLYATAIAFEKDTWNAIMDSPSDGMKAAQSFQPFTKAERIQQLNDIDQSVTQLLKSAGLAIKTLTACQSDPKSAGGTLEDLSDNFVNATNNYLKTLHSVDVRLKRQIFGLGEAGIVGKDHELVSTSDMVGPDATRAPTDKVVLDVGWLNSRSGKVGRDMEAELWAKARVRLTALADGERKDHSSEKAVIDEDADMGG